MIDKSGSVLSVRMSEEMREVAMSSDALARKDDGTIVGEAYYVILCPGRNITILPEYRLGQEYPKTYGHFHKPEAEETYEILLGEAALLLQCGIDTVKEVKLIKLKRGDLVTTPRGYAHALINLGKGPVVTVDNHDPTKFKNDYEKIREKSGFAYYLIEDDEGRPRAVPNPQYEGIPPLEYC